MALEKTIRERGKKVTCCLVSNQPINPWLVDVELGATLRQSHSIELRLGLPILIDELRHYDVLVEREKILEFVTADLSKHEGIALKGYLKMVRYVLEPAPRRRKRRWLPPIVLFQSKAEWKPPPAQFTWTTVSGVTLSDDDALVIKGECQDAMPE